MREPTLCILGVALLMLAPSAQEKADPAFARTVRPVLEAHCLSCHGAGKQKAGIRYDALKGYAVGDRHLWTRVHQMLSSGKMPPQERRRPGAAEVKGVLGWIEQQQATHRPGGTRRLNRREFSAALRDVTGLAVDYAQALPGDGKIAGFDTGADALLDAADSVDQHLKLTRRAVDGIRFLEPAPGKVLKAEFQNPPPDQRGRYPDVRKILDPWKSEGVYPKPRGYGRMGVGLLLQPKWLGDRGDSIVSVPPPASGRGILRLKVVVAAVKFMEGLPNPHLWVKVGGQAVDYREIAASPQNPVELLYEIQMDDLPVDKRGINVGVTSRVEFPYAVKGFENDDKSRKDRPVKGGAGLFRPKWDKKKLKEPEQQPIPFMALQRMELIPNYVAAWPPADWKADVGTIGDNESSARRLLGLWMERAWRRPVKRAEQERYLALYRKLRTEKRSFDDALRAAFQAVLLSGPFRYLAAPGEAGVEHHAVASRLSFMLTGEPPDSELRKLAAGGKLRDAKVLDAQVDRLLKDPRSDGFLRPFVTQWLELEQPITLAMDNIQKQDFRFGRYLKESMREETVACIAELFRGNRKAQELVDSDWTMMNNILARHYGYDGVEGGKLRKVNLRKDDPRGGGILGHAGIQSMLCWMGENWVIYRGAWTSRHLLDDPPPPPPLEVPELVPSDGQHKGKTVKTLIAQHRTDPKCSVCHDRLDPIGFAFQNFDISGRWREVEHERYSMNQLDGKVEWRGVGKSRPVDAAGALPRGEGYGSFDEFKRIVLSKYQRDMVRGILKNLFVYATGHKPDVAGIKEIHGILEREGPKGYRMGDLLKGVIRSKAFLGR